MPPRYTTSYQPPKRPSTYTRKKRYGRRILLALSPVGVGIIVATVLLVIHGQSVAGAKDSVTVSNTNTAGFSNSATTAATTAATVATTPSNTTSSLQTQLKNAWLTVAHSRVGDIDIAVYNNETKETTNYTNAAGTLNTASVVKLAIAEATLMQAQAAGTTLTPAQTTNLELMLENSDNTAATTLWNAAGGKSGMDTFFAKVGATSTVAADGGLWGLTQTTALDQVAIMNVLAYPGTYLTTASAGIIDDMLDDVESDQTWGVSAGLVGHADYKLKDGWLEDSETQDAYSATDSWTINSVGHITASGIDYTIAVLTQGQTTEQYGIETIEALSKATWTLLNQ